MQEWCLRLLGCSANSLFAELHYEVLLHGCNCTPGTAGMQSQQAVQDFQQPLAGCVSQVTAS
jgi:hypothetical protein